MGEVRRAALSTWPGFACPPKAAWRSPIRFPHALQNLAFCLLAGSLLTVGCGLLQAPKQVFTDVVAVGSPKQADPLDLQVQLQRYADEFSAQTGAAIDEYMRVEGTESARLDGLKWKLGASFAAVNIVSGPNPQANLLDLVALGTFTRMVLEERMPASSNAQSLRPWLETAQVLETNIWKLAARVLEPSQLEELRGAILQWNAQHPELHTAFFARPEQFAGLVKTPREKGAAVTSVFSVVNLDPTAGLDPAVREVTRTRLFGERVMYTMQRVPFLLRLQTLLLADQVLQQPDVERVVTNLAVMSESTDRMSRTLQETSKIVAQVPDHVSQERKEILAALDAQEGKLKDLAAEVKLTVEAAEGMSTSLNATLTTFDALMKRFGVGEPSTNMTPGTNSHPFNILEYGQVAQQVGAMAKDLSTLVTSVNQGMPQVEHLSQTATGDAQRLVDRAFRLGLVLIVVLLLGGLLVGLAYRFLAQKLSHPERVSAPVTPDKNRGTYGV